MKLRLPHRFQAALMAALASLSFTTLSTGTLGAAAAGALLAGQQAKAWTHEDVTHKEYASTDSDYTQHGWNYNAATGVVTLAEPANFTITFKLDNTALASHSGNTSLLYVTPKNDASVTWGYTASNTEITGLWQGNPWDNSGKVAHVTQTQLAPLAGEDGNVILTTVIGTGGTFLYGGESATGNKLFNADGLRSTNKGNLVKLTLNKDLVDSFLVQWTGSVVNWQDEAGTTKTYYNVYKQASGRSATIASDEGYDAYIVESGAELWFASRAATVGIGGDIYINGGYNDGYGALRLGTQTNGTLNLNGTIVLGGDSSISADAEGDSNRGTINFNGAVEGLGHSLTIVTPRNKGSEVRFNDEVKDLSAFTSSADTVFGADAVANLGTVTFTTANRTFTNNGSITVTDGTMNSIAGNGILTKTGAGTLTINSAGTSGGTVNVNEGTLAIGGGTATLQSLKVADTATLRLGNGASVVVGIAAKADRKVVTLGNLELTGASATLNTGTAWNDSYTIASLKSADGGSTLNLRSAATVTEATVFNLNGSASSSFSGTVDLGLTAGAGSTRKLALNINENAGSALSDSVVNFGGNNNNNYSLGLGIHAESVTVKGITTGNNVANTHRYIFAGAAVSDTTDFANINDGDKVHTLIINTGSSSETAYSTDAKVGAGLNIEKAGQGTQVFRGDMSAFSGDITVSGGTLALTSAVAGANAVAVNGGTLDLGNSLTTTGNLSVASFATLKFAGVEMLTVGGNLTLNGTLDVSRINYSEGATVTLASYTGKADITGYTLTGLGEHGATLSAANNALTLTFTDTPVPPQESFAQKYGTTLGTVQFVGDSITHGSDKGGTHNGASYRWPMHKIWTDTGVEYDENGYHTGNFSGNGYVPVFPGGSTYGGEDWDNRHSAQASGRARELINGDGRYANNTPASLVDSYPSDVFFLMIGTNDTLSDYSNGYASWDGVGYEGNPARIYNQMMGYDVTTETFSGTSRMDTIVDTFAENGGENSSVVVLSIPTWSPNHNNNNTAADFAAMKRYNEILKDWCKQQGDNVYFVDVNPGIVDVANTDKPFAAVPSMLNDGLHPSGQGDLIFAGNIARQLGYAGRSVGLSRSASGADWTSAASPSITVATGTSQDIADATFTTTMGYTVDFGAVYGDGEANGWDGAWNTSNINGLRVQVGDGTHTGTLTFSEAYVKWGDTVLYSRDNHVAGENFRIAYVNASVKGSDNVAAGYYVWMGDMLIGEALDAGTDSFNGIRLTSTGAAGSVTNLSWSDSAYAPTTTRYENQADAFHLVQVNPNPNHDNIVSKSLLINFTDAKENNNQFGTTGQASTGDLLLRRTGSHTNSWFGPVGVAHEGDVSILYDNLQATTNIFGVINGSVTNGNVSVVLDRGTSVGAGTYDGTGNCSIIGTYNQSIIGGDFRVEINNATLDGGIIMGVGYGSGKTIVNTLLYINHGATVGGDVFGGNYGGSKSGTNKITGKTDIFITGGKVNGSVYGGNKDKGTIDGDTNITITGGIITGDVNGGGTGGTIKGNTNVTIEGNLPSIGGSISAQYVTLKDVELNQAGYTDGFDCYTGTITGTETITLDNYTVEHLRAALVTKTLVLSNESITTIHNLTLTACTITAQAGTQVTLADSLKLGNTANFSGDVSFAEEGITIDVSELMQNSPGDRITLFSGAEGSKLGGLSDLSLISVTGSGSEDYHLAVGNEGQYLYLDRNTAALIPWHDSSENVIGFSGEGQDASPGSNKTYVAGAHVQPIDGHTGTGVYTSVTTGTGAGSLYANQGNHNTGDVYMLVNGVTMYNNNGAYGWIAAHNSGMLTGNASVKVENTGNGPAMLFGVVGGDVTGNVYTEVDDGTFASFTKDSNLLASYAGSYQGTISGEARLVTAGGTFEYDVYGGVHTNVKGGTNSIGSTKLDLRGGAFKGNVYGGGRTGSVTGDTNVIVSGTAVVDGSVYGGGTGGTVGGSTNVTISGDDAQVKGNVYGNTDVAQGGTVTLKDRTNGFGDDSRVIVTEALNLQNTQGAVSSRITAETVNLTGNSDVTINNLTLTPTSDTDTCALTMATGSALTLDGTLSISKAASYTGDLTLTDGMTLDLSRMQLTGYEEEPVTLLSSNNGALTYHDLTSYDLNLGHAEYDSYSLSVDSGNNLVLTFTQPTPTDSLIWDGTQNSNWSTKPADQNWHAYEADPGTSAFTTDRKVTFNEGTPSVVLTEDISSGNIAVRDGANVTLHTDPLVAHGLETPRLSVADGSTLTVDANVALTTSAISGSGTVDVGSGGTLVLEDGVDSNASLIVHVGGTVQLPGTGEDGLAVQNMDLKCGAMLDVSKIQFESGSNTVKIADIDGRLDIPSADPGHGETPGSVVDAVGIANFGGGMTDVVHLVYSGNPIKERLHEDDEHSLRYYFEDAGLYLVKEQAGLYWNNKDAQGNLIGGVWDVKQDATGGTANWNDELDGDKNSNTTTPVNSPLYFISDSKQAIEIQVDQSKVQGKDGAMQASSIVIGGGGTFNFTRLDDATSYDITLDPNQASSLIVRSNTTAHFDMNVSGGDLASFYIEDGAKLVILDEYSGETGASVVYNQGEFILSVPAMMAFNAIVNEGTAHIGRVWDENDELLVKAFETPDTMLMITDISIYNQQGKDMTLSADSIGEDPGTRREHEQIQNEGNLTFRADNTLWGSLYNSLAIEGMGIVNTVGKDTAAFYETVENSKLNTGARRTEFSKRVTITDTTTLTAEAFAKDQSDKRSTTVFNYSSQLGEHVVMGGNTTLDLNTGSEANPVYTMGEVTSTGEDQVMMVRSGVTANVADGVSLGEGKAQIAGSGKLTIGGATSTVGELAATGGGTAVVELNGATAEGTDLVLNAKRLSNTDSTTLQVVNTDADSAKTAQFNIGDATPAGGDYKGKLQYGVGANAAEGSGMNLIIKDNNVAAGAVLETSFSESAPAGSAANIVVDTAAAKVLGLTSDDNSANKTMVVSGSAGAANKSLEITGDDNYEYDGKLGENLDIAYTGEGYQGINGGVDGFKGKVTVDSDSTDGGVLAIMNAASVGITDLTIGANDTLVALETTDENGTAVVSGTLTAQGGFTTKGSGTASVLYGDLTLGDTSMLDVSDAGGQGGLDLFGALTINEGAQLSSGVLTGVAGLGWFEMYDLAFDVTEMLGFDQVDWSEGVDVTEVFANTGLKAEEYYVRYSQNEAGGNGDNVGAVYIYHIPEPTTSTLSLLALMALAARRRRK